jgi:hypothetical protein
MRAECDRISSQSNNDRDRRGCPFAGHCRGRWPGDDHLDGQVDKFLDQLRKPLSLAIGVAVLHGHILVFDPAEIAQAGFESRNEG